MKEERLYWQATKELQSESRNEEVWLKSVALCEGDEKKARLTYLNLRVEEAKADKGDPLHPIEQVEGNASYQGAVSQHGFLNKLKNGDYGLAVTFWGFALCVDLVANFLAEILAMISQTTLVIFGIVYLVFRVFVLVGVWNAAEKYAGASICAVAAKWTVVFQTFLMVAVLFTAIVFHGY